MTAEQLIRSVGSEYGFEVAELCSRESAGPRNHKLNEAKRVAQYLVRQNTNLGWNPMAALFCCTFSNCRAKVTLATRQIWGDDEFAARVRRLEQELGLKKTVDEVQAMPEDELPPDPSPGGAKSLNREAIAGARVYQRGDA